jgi:hypothetical protein
MKINKDSTNLIYFLNKAKVLRVREEFTPILKRLKVAKKRLAGHC